jgi:hypothetical protein
MLCHRGALWWAFDQVMTYSYQDPFCCPNPAIAACPASPACAVPAIPTAPPASTPPTGPHPYYPGEGWF